MLKIKPVYIVIILLTLISQRIVYNDVVNPEPEWRIEMQNTILKGEAATPYQYRILKPILGKTLETILYPLIKNEISRHFLAYKIILYVLFFLIYLLFYLFLKNFFTDIIAILGLLFLQIVIPLSLTNQWQEGDFINLFFYLLAFYLMFKEKDYLIPLIVGIGAFNREQSIFILIFYAAYLIEQKKLFKPRSFIVLASSIILYVVAYYSMRFYFGFKPVVHTVAFNTEINIAHWGSILRLWIEMVLIFAIVSFAVFKKSRKFFKLSFLSVILYVILFFFNGIMGELAKFLPAYVIMISMFMQIFNKEYTGITLSSTIDS